ncbi:MAG: histidine kinase [Bacteroidales bacterium]|jgi:hypothetical protein|nr:histidine kinase [Bacteroidales bacterium]MCI2146161.1 histidine kinase [Bacteroidales bacterium]
MSNKSSRKYLENTIYIVIWLIILFVPVMSMALLDSSGSIDWNRIFIFWIRILPFLLLFLIHNFLIAPILTKNKNYPLYFTLAFIVTLAITFVSPVIFTYAAKNPGFGKNSPSAIYRMQPPGPGKMANPIPFRSIDTIAPPADDIKRNVPSSMQTPPGPEFRNTDQGRGEKKMANPALHRLFDPLDPNSNIISFFIGIMLIGLNLAIKMFIKSIEDEHKLKELENAKLKNELDYLKVQLNPHFFMNTLNNIHALVDIDSEKAKKTIIEFSKLMRFVLYDADSPTIDMDKEVGFIVNYVKLMKLRYTDDVEITFEYPETIPNAELPPLLFVSFLENAFKYGVRYDDKSYIRISIRINGNNLLYEVVNSYWPISTVQCNTQITHHGGIGIPNSKKRLDLLYGNKYQLDYGVKGNEYRVKLSIPFIIKKGKSRIRHD